MNGPFWARFRPRLVEALQTYTRADLLSDVTAGITVGRARALAPRLHG